jgi:hypothetical protein
MNEAADRSAGDELSHLGNDLASHVSVPPVMRVLRRTTPAHRALFRLDDVAAEISVSSVTRVMSQETPRRRALVAGCSICALGALTAALVVVPGASNGSTGPSARWVGQADGLASTLEPETYPLVVPPFDASLGALPGVAPAAATKPAADKPSPTKPVATKPAATKPAPTKPAADKPAAAKPRPATQPPPTTSQPPRATTITILTTSPSSSATQGNPVTLTLKASIIPNLSRATVAGTVQFKDAGADIGSPVTVTNGTASSPLVTLDVGEHSLTAMFTSTAANVSGSTSKTVTFQVKDAGDDQEEGEEPEGKQQEEDQPVRPPHVEQDEIQQSPAQLVPDEQAPAENAPAEPAPAEQPRHG